MIKSFQADEMNMQASGHTRLMNYIIGMCKKDTHWITTLSDLGYEVQILEQTIHLSTGYAVKPDVVSASNSLLHSLVIDVKGGKTVDQSQLDRYSDLKTDDLRWVSWNNVYDKSHLTLDVCICDLSENHNFIKLGNSKFPMLTFGPKTLSKEGNFKNHKLNSVFNDDISLENKTEPLSYYPFSDEDETSYIALHVIRTIVSISLKNSKKGIEMSEQQNKNQFVAFDDVLASNFNRIWKILSKEHKDALRTRIIGITERVFSDEKIKESLGIIQQKKGYRLTKNLSELQVEAQRLIEELESEKGQTTLGNFGIGI